MYVWYQPTTLFPDFIPLSQKEKISEELQNTRVPNGPDHLIFLQWNNKTSLFAKVPLILLAADLRKFLAVKIMILY